MGVQVGWGMRAKHAWAKGATLGKQAWTPPHSHHFSYTLPYLMWIVGINEGHQASGLKWHGGVMVGG